MTAIHFSPAFPIASSIGTLAVAVKCSSMRCQPFAGAVSASPVASFELALDGFGVCRMIALRKDGRLPVLALSHARRVAVCVGRPCEAARVPHGKEVAHA